MQLLIGNPQGFWALSALIAVLLIHLFQERRRRERVSTLFLFDFKQPSQLKGHVLDRIRHSRLLWLQILAVVLITLLLIEPRWIKPNSVQKIVVVLDSSLSMDAFKVRGRGLLISALEKLRTAAHRTDWVVLESDTNKSAVYKGSSLRDLQARLVQWRPKKGTHDFVPALQLGQLLLAKKGLVVFVSDRRVELPPGVLLFSVGLPIENVGFSGLISKEEDNQKFWRVLVRNYSAKPQNRTWQLELDGNTTRTERLFFQPGETKTLEGIFPKNDTTIELRLSGDQFEVDDYLPLVSPKQKKLLIYIDSDKVNRKFLNRVFAAFDEVELVANAQGADLLVKVLRYPDRAVPKKNAVVFAGRSGPTSVPRGAPLIRENHYLTRDLSWHTLRVHSRFPIKKESSDELLMHYGSRPLVFLRSESENRQLIFNFTPDRSNASRSPSFMLLLYRFVEELRSRKRGLERKNVEINQSLSLALGNSDVPLSILATRRDGKEERRSFELGKSVLLRAPGEPAFFSVFQGEELLQQNAAHFADVREADFHDAETINQLTAATKELKLQNSEQDFLFPLWIVLLGVVVLLSWIERGR